MVDKGRSFWRRVAAGIAFALIFASDFHGSRAYAAGIAATEQISTTNSKKKSNRHTRSKPKPPKPVPLDQLAPVPIELGESDLNPLATFFQGLATLLDPLLEGPACDPVKPAASHHLEYCRPRWDGEPTLRISLRVGKVQMCGIANIQRNERASCIGS